MVDVCWLISPQTTKAFRGWRLMRSYFSWDAADSLTRSPAYTKWVPMKRTYVHCQVRVLNFKYTCTIIIYQNLVVYRRKGELFLKILPWNLYFCTLPALARSSFHSISTSLSLLTLQNTKWLKTSLVHPRNVTHLKLVGWSTLEPQSPPTNSEKLQRAIMTKNNIEKLLKSVHMYKLKSSSSAKETYSVSRRALCVRYSNHACMQVVTQHM